MVSMAERSLTRPPRHWDDALAIAAEASSLAIEEAASKVNEYSAHDLNGAVKDIQAMEGLFLETLEKVAKAVVRSLSTL